jgi:putative ABC transport system substrate-binding protein
MSGHTKAPNTKTRRVICCMLASLLLTACGSAPPAKIYTIGVLSYSPTLSQVFEGFKARMAELGYVEGKTVSYIYPSALEPEPQALEREVKRLMDQKVDLFLTTGTRPTLAAKKAVEGTTIPVVFAPMIMPVKEEVVESLRRPGGNVTGVQNGDTIPKALEWLHTIVPQATKVYVIYHARDRVAHTAVQSLPETATSLGVELVLAEVHSLKEAVAVLETLPKEAAIFQVPTPSLQPISAFIEAAVQRRIAVGATSHGRLQEGAVVTYGGSLFAMGQQAARLADQIRKGTKPADLPVETAEYCLQINLQAATAIGLDIPDELLRRANLVIR